MTNGAPTTTTQPIISTENHTVLLPVEIWLGGTKLSTNASRAPQKPRQPRNHISPLPLPRRNGRSVFFILYRRTMAAENMSMYMIRYSSTVSCDRIW